MKTYYVYILSSQSGTLYIGMTSNLHRRLDQHRRKLNSSFTAKYNCHRLLHCESFANPNDAINREKQLKSWRREKKIALIDAQNPQWQDLTPKPLP